MIQKITSRDNPKLKSAKLVRDGKNKASIFVEGVRLAEEALGSQLNLEYCLISDDFGSSVRESILIENLCDAEANIYEVPPKIFDSLADTRNSQGIILVCERPKCFDLNAIRGSSTQSLPIYVYLHEVSDPSNLGAVLRTAEAAGVAGIIISDNAVDVFSPKALRASMGAAFRLPISFAESLDTILEWATGNDLISTGAVVKADLEYTKTDWRKPRLLIMGSEAHGLDENLLRKLDELTMIPMGNDVESLNLAVSTGIILYEARRQNSLNYLSD